MTGPEKVPVEKLSDEARGALRREILFLADSKRILGIRYSDWLLGAPSIETAIAASAMAQDEWGHARLIYAMLKDFGEDPVPVEHDRPGEAYCSIASLDRPFDDWAAFVAAVVLVDASLASLMEGLAAGVYEAAGARIPKMLSEEEFHQDLGRAWYRRIAGSSGEGRARLREATEAFLPDVFASLDTADPAFRALVEEGLTRPGGELREDFLRRVGPLVAELGVDPDEVEVPRDEWDPERRRLSGRPDRESVERARGDLNRALFVE